MEKVNGVLTAVQSFLSQAQSIGIIKEFSVIPCDVGVNDSSEFDTILSEFKATLLTFSQGPTDYEKKEDPAYNENKEDPINKEEENSCIQDLPDANIVVDNEIKDSQPTKLKKELVQIQVDENEIKRRISAFISRKRKEVDEWNIQEFCNRPYVEEENPVYEQVDSCARVDTIFIPRFGSKSHVKVSKVENRWGPQTQPKFEVKKIKKEPGTEIATQSNVSLETIQERLQNMESHLKLKSETSIRCSIFQRLKDLEDRILFLEGISPDYFHISGPNFNSPKKRSDSEKEKTYANWSVDDLQKKIQSLRESLKLKSVQIKKEPVS